MKKTIRMAAAIATLTIVAGCSSDADVAARNLSKAADMFEIERRVVFYNGITNEYMLTIEGRCSLGSGNSTKSVTVTCKTGPEQYKKHFLGLSDNVTYFAEQLQEAQASAYRYRVIFKPESLVPNIDLETSANAG
ncbi:MAG TPA: hypothetical protein VK972_06300 [Wenzhouxiangella sp.]|nr:hypothetical protein [Wenzhouxiangella sp.]